MDTQGEVHGFEAQRRRRDGTAILAAASIRSVRGADGKVLSFECVAEDITQRKLPELPMQAEAKGFQTTWWMALPWGWRPEAVACFWPIESWSA